MTPAAFPGERDKVGEAAFTAGRGRGSWLSPLTLQISLVEQSAARRPNRYLAWSMRRGSPTLRREQRCEEAGENPARSRHCDRAVTPGSQTFGRCPPQHCQGRAIPKELLVSMSVFPQFLTSFADFDVTTGEVSRARP
jgi:hypothetical protein